ncbi:MAG: restriction endonuclease, partial [Planctomycetaceae bacterium]|nr:restriction endonuclease [Planctomycetaceae bacterium]
MDRLLRSQIWQRADSQCEYCQMSQEFTEAGHEVDHIIAEKHHGLTTLENLGLACFPCNNHKGPNIAGIDPKTGQVTRLFHPRIDDWSAHFAWRGATLMGYAVSDFLYTDA